MKNVILAAVAMTVVISCVGYVYAQGGIAWPDRQALVNYIDNEPDAHLTTLEGIISNLGPAGQQTAIDAIWNGAFGKDTTDPGADLVGIERRAEQYLGVDVTVTEVDGVVTISYEL